tara:strand:+ start:436 stop:774 length:339 start_codon:yes stop_codon:yes gene_type:complete
MTTSSKRTRRTDADDWAHHLKVLAQAKLDPARALKNLKGRLALRRRNLLDPDWNPTPKDFPVFYPGMATASYLAAYQEKNSWLRAMPYTHADRAAPFYDSTTPDIVTVEVLA